VKLYILIKAESEGKGKCSDSIPIVKAQMTLKRASDEKRLGSPDIQYWLVRSLSAAKRKERVKFIHILWNCLGGEYFL
jgi:hypothetical protein